MKKLERAIFRIERQLREQHFDPRSTYAQGAKAALGNALAICREVQRSRIDPLRERRFDEPPAAAPTRLQRFIDGPYTVTSAWGYGSNSDAPKIALAWRGPGYGIACTERGNLKTVVD